MFTRSVIDARRMLRIGFVTQDMKAGKKLRECIEKKESVDLQLIDSKSVTAARAPRNFGIFVYDLEDEKKETLGEFDRFMRERPPDIPVIVLSPSASEDLVRWFLRLRVADWLTTPLSPGELLAACGRIISQTSSLKQDLRCVTFMGARGGVGTTTLAITAALILSGSGKKHASTCLVDLDLVSGACADYLDLKANWQFDELISNPARLDNHMLDIMLSAHPTGISVLASQRKFSDLLAFDAEVVTRALDLASQKFDNIVVDLPRFAGAWTENVIAGSNEVYVVTEATIPGLKIARRLVTEIIEKFDGEVQPRIIVNKYERSLFGSGLSGHEVNEILQKSFAGYVRNDPRAAREAIDRGVPINSIKSRSVIVRDLTRILKGK
jgi:pilus assembly protein CpaE